MTMPSRDGMRIAPQLPAQSMKTYGIVAPLSTHWRPATCAEVECSAYANGWTTTVDTGTDLGAKQARYIREQSGRHYTADPVTLGSTVVAFKFPPGQRCFRQHQVPLEREPLYVVRGGDWRGNPRGIEPRQHAHADDWVDDFATHQQTLADRLNQG